MSSRKVNNCMGEFKIINRFYLCQPFIRSCHRTVLGLLRSEHMVDTQKMKIDGQKTGKLSYKFVLYVVKH